MKDVPIDEFQRSAADTLRRAGEEAQAITADGKTVMVVGVDGGGAVFPELPSEDDSIFEPKSVSTPITREAADSYFS